jgi:hypothetical protein
MLKVSPQLTFVYISGQGTDSTERGRIMWARVKGKTENELLAMGFKAAYMFRANYIQPLRGVQTKTLAYRLIYAAMAWMYPLFSALAPKFATTSVNVGRAMIEVAAEGSPRHLLLNSDINELARLAELHEGTPASNAPFGGSPR